MIQLRMTVADVGQLRFAYSPLAEVAESLYMLASGRIPKVHREWFTAVRDALSDVDMDLLLGAVPARSYMADFLFGSAVDRNTTIGDQLGQVAATPYVRLIEEMEIVWQGSKMPAVVRELLAMGSAAPGRLADELRKYWAVAVEPHWLTMRATFDDDVAFRAMQLVKGGISAMLADLHPEVSVQGAMLTIDRRSTLEGDLSTEGVVLVPSVFAWPNVVFATDAAGPACLTYPARGVGNLWGGVGAAGVDGETLGALLGRSRAQILATLARPLSTTELAAILGQSAPAVSQHLAVLKRNGLVVSWRSGRSVLYQRTDLASSVVEAGNAPLEAARTTAWLT
jgi:DNA-binding transcriptional ArsR family regulator